MFSRIDNSGTTKTAEPRFDAISTKLYVWFPTVASKGGRSNEGSPGLTCPACENGGLKNWLGPGLAAKIRTGQHERRSSSVSFE